MLFVGILLAVIGLALRYVINRRIFNRRNAAGVEEFTSYGASVGIRLLESIGRLLGLLLLLAGAALLLLHFLGRS